MNNSLLLIVCFLIVIDTSIAQVNPMIESVESVQSKLPIQSLGQYVQLSESGCGLYDLTHSRPTVYDVNEIHFVTAEIGYAAGESGLVLKTVDGGNSWKELTTGSWQSNYDLSFKDELNGFVKSSFSMYETTDGGETWTNTGVSTSDSNGELIFIDDALGFYSDNQDLYRTTDRKTWSSIKSFDENIKHVKVFNETEIIVNTQTGIYHSIDNGDTWDTLYENASAEMSDIEYLSLDTWYMTTSYLSSIGGVAFISTTDGGVSWDTLKLDIFGSFHPRIYFLDENTGFVYGGDDTETYGDYAILKTINGGETWTETNATGSWNRWANDMVFTDETTGFVVGRFGAIQKTTDSGDNWNSVTSNETYFLMDVIYNGDIGLAAGEGGVVFKTLDKGLTWEAKDAKTDRWINEFSWVGSTVYGISYEFGVGSDIIKSTDNGETWSLVGSFNEDLRTIHFFDGMKGIAAGISGNYYETSDGGENWSLATFSGNPHIRVSAFPSAEVGYLAAEQYLLKTTNGGESFSPVNTTDFGEVYSTYFLNDDIGFLGGSYGRLYKTTDGGLSFDTLFINSNPEIFSIHFFDESYGYITTSFNAQYTLNGGESWINISLPTSSEIRDIYFHEDQRATVVGRGGAIFDLLVGEPTIELEIITDSEWCMEDVQTISVLDDFPYLSSYSLNWSLSGGGEITQDDNSIMVTWTEDGTHTLSVFPANSCGQGTTSTIEITVTSAPEIPTLVFDGLSTLSVETEDSVQWYLDDSPIENANENSLSLDADGIYQAKIINECGVSKSDLFEFPVPLSVADFSLQLYPNPASEFLEVKVNDNNKRSDIYMINLAGKRVTPNLMQNNSHCILDVSQLPRGLYFVVIEGADVRQHAKIVLE